MSGSCSISQSGPLRPFSKAGDPFAGNSTTRQSARFFQEAIRFGLILPFLRIKLGGIQAATLADA